MPTVSRTRPDGQLISAAGEFLTAGKLFKLGYQVGVTYGNAKAVDLLVLNPRTGRKWAVQVKTQHKKNCFPAQPERLNREDICVFVRLNGSGDQEEFFVVPCSVLLDDRKHFFGRSLETSPSFAAINYGPLLEYKDNWRAFEEELTSNSE
jgi:hypothetical protein